VTHPCASAADCAHRASTRVKAALGLWLAAGLCVPAQAEPQHFDLDPANTFVQFEVRHFDTSTLRGRFGPLQGEVMLDAEAGKGHIGLVIDTRTLDTGFRLLDARLRQPDLLAVSEYPQAYFVAERFRFEGGRPVELTGEFTLRGVSSSLTLTARRFSCVDGGAGRGQRCGGDFEGDLLRSSFGASFGLPLVSDRVHLRVQVEAVRRP
jgi:polyisoprenoid-binding protein YceI